MQAWEFRESPFTVTRQRVESLPNHRRAYLDYEGPISGDRGSVRRVAAGMFELLHESPTEWVARLLGDTIDGELRFVCAFRESGVWEATLALQSI